LVGEVSDADRELGQAFQSMTVAGRRMRPKVALAAAEQASRSTLNCIADLELDHGPRSAVGALKRAYDAVQQRRGLGSVVREVPRIAAQPGAVSRELSFRRKGVGAPPDRHTRLLLRVQTEQPPLGSSHVRLSDQTDEFGRRMLDVAWHVGEEERRTCLGMAEVFGTQLEDLGLGRLAVFPWLEDPREFAARAVDFYHHAGTTRMSRDAEQGVVDPDCRVHGREGLFVVGGSVFPASGYAHPTLTIVALALRLADHLAVTQ
jgi:choline dehydrogenase-like flavoprotein